MIPVLVVTGFLGAGKTTLLGRLLRDPAWADTAVVVNEFGEVPLDHALVAASEDTLVSLSTGCLCCAVRGDLAETLLDLHRRRDAGTVPRYARVVVETSGLADPTPILHSLMTDRAVAATHCLHSVVALVDGCTVRRRWTATRKRGGRLCSPIVCSSPRRTSRRQARREPSRRGFGC